MLAHSTLAHSVLALDFSAPGRLWLLAGAVALAVAYAAMQVRRRRDAAKFASPALLPLLVSGRAPWWRHAVAALFAAGVVLTTVAAAEPTVPGSAARQQATIIVAIDTSDSMKATDVAPSRLAAAVAEAKTFISDLPSAFSVGIVTVDANPKVLVAPSTDHPAVEVALDRLATSPGTAHAQVQSAGQTVDVPVDPTALEAIAKGTGGKFFQAASEAELRQIYADINADVTVVPIDRSVAVWFAGAALLLLLAASLASMLRTGRVVWT